MAEVMDGCGFAACNRPAVAIAWRARPCGCPDPKVVPPCWVCPGHAEACAGEAPNASTCTVCGERNHVQFTDMVTLPAGA